MEKTLHFSLNPHQLQNLLGSDNYLLRHFEHLLQVICLNRGQSFHLKSKHQESIDWAEKALDTMVKTHQHKPFADAQKALVWLEAWCAQNLASQTTTLKPAPLFKGFRVQKRWVVAKSANQSRMIEHFESNIINFCFGPAGTGKSWLAIAYALHLLEKGSVSKLVLTRPVVEAGEKLGFLPGDLSQKIDPYLKPLQDALDDFYPTMAIEKMMQDKVIEILPLAYMRGRTLKNSLIVLDEAQNTTTSQMKMFLTRLGENSRLILCGDLSQNDLPPKVESGLNDAFFRFKKLEKDYALAFSILDESDIVRHSLIAPLLSCYQDKAIKSV